MPMFLICTSQCYLYSNLCILVIYVCICVNIMGDIIYKNRN